MRIVQESSLRVTKVELSMVTIEEMERRELVKGKNWPDLPTS